MSNLSSPGSSIAENRVGQDFAQHIAQKSTQINSGGGSPYERYVVLEVISDPVAQADSLQDLSEKYGINIDLVKSCPFDSVIAQPTSVAGYGFEKPMFLYPFHQPHLRLPIKPGEQIWVFFERSSNVDFGYWVGRITEPRHADDLSHTHADRKHHESSKAIRAGDVDRKQLTSPTFSSGTESREGSISRSTSSLNSQYGKISYEELIRSNPLVKRRVFARMRKRPGDFLLGGSEGSFVLVGSDRSKLGEVTSGKFTERPSKDRPNGSIVELVAGFGTNSNASNAPAQITNSMGEPELDKRQGKERAGEGLPDYENDVSRLLLSEDAELDTRFSISPPGVSPVDSGGSIVLKTDHARIIARKTLTLMVKLSADTPDEDASYIVLDGNDITFIPSRTGYVKLGGTEANKAILVSPVAIASAGVVTSPPLVDTLGASMGAGGVNGEFSKKVLIV